MDRILKYVRAHVKLLEIAFAAGALTCMFYSLYRAHEVAVIAVDASTVGDDFVAFSTATALLEKSAGGTDKTLPADFPGSVALNQRQAAKLIANPNVQRVRQRLQQIQTTEGRTQLAEFDKGQAAVAKGDLAGARKAAADWLSGAQISLCTGVMLSYAKLSAAAYDAWRYKWLAALCSGLLLGGLMSSAFRGMRQVHLLETRKDVPHG